MNSERKKKHLLTEPVVAMKVCGSVALGDQKITSKCLKAFKYFKQRHTGKTLETELRDHLYKDIERLIVTRRGSKQREMQSLTQYWDKQMNLVKPRVSR